MVICGWLRGAYGRSAGSKQVTSQPDCSKYAHFHVRDIWFLLDTMAKGYKNVAMLYIVGKLSVSAFQKYNKINTNCNSHRLWHTQNRWCHFQKIASFVVKSVKMWPLTFGGRGSICTIKTVVFQNHPIFLHIMIGNKCLFNFE